MSDLLEIHVPVYGTEIVCNLKIGHKPKLKWLSIDVLFIDPTYQRSVGRSGLLNIKRIVEGFNWSMFSPLIVAVRDGGKYAVIDGQHRAMAAKTLGIVDTLPCMIIDGGVKEEAKAFAVVNGQVTPVSPAQLYYARIIAEDPVALDIQDICASSGVKILKFPQPYKVGDTHAIGCIERCLKLYGRDALISALSAITESGEGNPGFLRQQIIAAMCEVLYERKHWRDAGLALFEALDEPTITVTFREAVKERANIGGSLLSILSRRFRAQLTRHLDVPQKLLKAAS